ncbi:MAG TPA: RibD family protein [Candidatus Dormibacteraeota bacterium]|nr:RibD family protein [Candidatus Dormibacteraeota bacterium]
MITVHYAQSLDGRIATRSGDSQWIGGEESLLLAHRLRGSHDAVLVGVGTVIADNPRLTTRLVQAPSPRRIVVDSRLRLPRTAHVLTDGAAPTTIVTTTDAPQALRRELARDGVDVLVAAADPARRVNLGDMVRLLEQTGVHSLLVEGGASIITSFLRARLCDRLVICVAPRLIGKGIEAVGDLGTERLSDALGFLRANFTPCGEDIVFDGEIARAAELAG